MSDNKQKPEDMKFEEALAKLEETVRILEEGKAPLEDSIRYYEEGIRLVRLCSEKLTEARRKITEVTDDDKE